MQHLQDNQVPRKRMQLILQFQKNKETYANELIL